MTRRARSAAARATLASLLALAAALLLASSAGASGRQVSLFQDDDAVTQNPVSTLQELRHLGVKMIRVNLRWSVVAPNPMSRKRPNFNATNPNAYPPGAWHQYDAIVQAANTDGIQVMFNVTGFAPVWAQGANPARYGAHYDWEFAFMPNDNQFKQFVEAAGKRYPSVHTWELYNEPNFGEDLSPQAIDHSTVLWAPVMYRGLANAAWNALHATGHSHDTFIIGALAAHGAHVPSHGRSFGLPGAYGETPPLEFVRDLYCLNGKYRPYRGAAAKVRKCPTTAAASRRFRAQNPALFKASGFSDHPYPLGADGSTPPTTTHYRNANFAGFSQLPNMIKALDKTQRAYHSGKKFPLWNTEYGYITNPPNKSEHFSSLATQAFYDNWAEYLSWKNPRIASAMQYLLYDPNPSVGTPECGGFASGLVFFPSGPTTSGCAAYTPGSPKPGLAAYRMPIYIPSGRVKAGHAVTVWGCVRPAPVAAGDTHQAQTAQVQFQRGGQGAWSTVATVRYASASSSCYFTRQIKFPGSGSVRISYQYPVNDLRLEPGINQSQYYDPLSPSVSRSASVTIK